MSSTVISAIRGLNTAQNELSVPKGTLLQADNCIITNDGLLEPRKSQNCTFDRFGSDNNDFISTTMFYQNTPIINYINSNTSVSKLTKFTGSSPTAYTYTNYTGTYTPPDLTTIKMRGVQAQKSLFFTTTTGIKVLDDLASTPKTAGIGRAGDIFNLTATPGGGAVALPINSRVCYRDVWTTTDFNKRLIIGVPSGFSYVSNNSKTQKEDLNLSVPHLPGAGSSYNFRVYRSFGSLGATLDASTDVYQVWEQQGYDELTGVSLAATGTTTVTATKAGHSYRAGDQFNLTVGNGSFPAGVYTVVSVVAGVSWTYVQAGAVTSTLAGQVVDPVSYFVTDIQPEALLGDALYTNASDGEGNENANYQPPKANDVTLWDQSVWYANTTSKYRFQLTMVGVGAPNGIVAGDTVTIAGLTYTARAAPTLISEFKISASGTPTQQIFETANSLIQSINTRTDNTLVNAYLTNGENEPLPQITIEERAVGGSVFMVTAFKSTSWFPNLADTTQQSADNDRAAYRVFYSKPDQPEAVPLLNFLDIGSKNKAVLRVLANKDKLFVIKEDGTYTVSGQAPYRVDLLDNTALPFGADTFSYGGNRIFGYTNQGAVSITNSGVQVISNQIQDQLSQTYYSDATLFSSAVNELDSQFLLSLPTGSAVNSFVFCYNYLLQAWTRWPMQRNSIAFTTSGTRTLGIYGDTLIPRRVRVQDSAYAVGNSTYADYLAQVDLVSSNHTSKVITFDVSVAGGWTNLTLDTLGGFTTGGAIHGTFEPGDANSFALVSTYGDAGAFSFVYASPNVLANDYSSSFSGSTSLYTSIPITIKFASQLGDSPGDMKQDRSVTWLFKYHDIYTATSTVYSDYSTTTDSSAITFHEVLAQGDPSIFTWTPNLNGIDPRVTRPPPANKRLLVAKEKQRNQYLVCGIYVSESFLQFALNGLQVDWDQVSERGNR